MFGNKSRANAVFIVKVSAKIPVGYTLKNAHNAHGTGSKQELLTSMAGTGKYEIYIFKETCGSTGTFSTMNHLYLSGPVKPGNDPLDPDNAPLEWFVDYATVFDLTADGYGDIESVTKDDFASQLGFADFDALVANAITKGPLIKAGMINTVLLSAESLVAVDGFIDKLSTNILKAGSITAKMLDTRSIFSMKINVNDKFIVDENGIMSCVDAKISGNIYTKPFHVTSDNFSAVTTAISGNMYTVDFDKTGLNIQFDYVPNPLSTFYLDLPRKMQYEGAEASVMNAFPYSSGGTTMFGHIYVTICEFINNKVSTTTVIINKLAPVRFKCIVVNPEGWTLNDPSRLVDGKIVEWI
jgi:putative prophage lambdaBa01, minor structural protein